MVRGLPQKSGHSMVTRCQGGSEKETSTSFRAADEPKIFPDAIPASIQRALVRGFDCQGRGYVDVSYIFTFMGSEEFTFQQVYIGDNFASEAISDVRGILNAIARNDFDTINLDSIAGSVRLTKSDRQIIVRDLRYITPDGDEEDFHDYPPALARLFSSSTIRRLRSSILGRLFSNSAMRRRRSSISLVLLGAPPVDLEKPQPRSGRYAIAQIQRNGHSTCSMNRLTQPAAWIASSWG